MPDLARSVEHYEAVFGVKGDPASALGPRPHPFASAGPVAFRLGGLTLLLYQASAARGTHPGDVGLGVTLPASEVAEICARAGAVGARVLRPSGALPGDGRSLAVVMLPDRHFFELVSAPEARDEGGEGPAG